MAAAGAIPAEWLRDSRRHEKIGSSEGKSWHSAAGGDAKRNVSELFPWFASQMQAWETATRISLYSLSSVRGKARVRQRCEN